MFRVPDCKGKPGFMVFTLWIIETNIGIVKIKSYRCIPELGKLQISSATNELRELTGFDFRLEVLNVTSST